jgi:hypothetical protein
VLSLADFSNNRANNVSPPPPLHNSLVTGRLEVVSSTIPNVFYLMPMPIWTDGIHFEKQHLDRPFVSTKTMLSEWEVYFSSPWFRLLNIHDQ